uniref:Condensin complex subunit 1 n=1 Tax=Falco tinnunculus TaxID=100819 RepID=A0A8C4U7W2_FALTI
PSPQLLLFRLPLNPADLRRDSGPGCYVVQRVLPASELPPALTAFRSAFKAHGALAVLQHFDSLYRALKGVLMTFHLFSVVSHHSNELPAIVHDSGLSRVDCAAHLNALKMNCYLLTGLVDAFETETCRNALLEVNPGGKNKKNRTKTSGSFWEEEREPVLRLLTQLLQLDLHQLWGGSAVDENFVSLMTGSCYHILENPSIGLQKYRATREAVTHLLAAVLTHYDHMFSAIVKITQMLQHFEHVAPVFAQAVSLWATEYGLKSLVGELLREIGQKFPQDLAHDTSGVKGYATFITELAEQIPALVLANMSVLLHLLNGESYMMRNAILAAMAEVLVRVLNGDQLEEAARGTRDKFLSMLRSHICDIHGFVRSRVLQLFTRIVQCRVLPLTQFQSVVSVAVGRLKDKSVMVVKNAIQLLAAFLSNNPFSCKVIPTSMMSMLDICLQAEYLQCAIAFLSAVITSEEEWEAMLPEVRAATQQLFQPLQEGEEEVLEVGETVESTLEQITVLLRKLNYKLCLSLVLCSCPGENSEDSPRGSSSPQAEEVVPEKQPQTELAKQEMLVQYLQDAYNFSVKITEALSLISKMMHENSISVVQESIEFLVTASQFGVPQAVLGVRRMLPLIWSKEPGVKEAVLDAYRRLYLSPSGKSERARAQSLVHSLSLIMADASLGTIQCLEEIISEFVQKDEINPAVIQLLWERFTEKTQCSPLEQRAAVILLGMMARGKPEIIGSNLDVLVTVGLSEKVCEDYRLAQEVCNAISKLPALEQSNAPFRLPQDHMLFASLSETLSKGFAQPSGHWIPFMETAVTLIYKLAEGAGDICAHVLQMCSQQALEKLEEADGVSDGAGSLPTFMLMHLLSLVGQVALQQVQYLEVSVSTELRRRRCLREEKSKKHSDSSMKNTGNETTMEEELGLVGASADDTEAELIRSICETELLDDKHLLSAFVPLVLKVCKNPGLYSDPALSAAAALSLGKVCMISSEFCSSHLRLLLTMMEKSTLPGVRSNLIIAAGDLAIRFPNVVEPWTSHLCARLRDPCPSVRHTAGLVMTYLILEDMIKVKGQVSEMATLLIDPEEAIMGLAHNFFSELSNKDNAIYNLLPDIISHLSDPNCGIEEEPFHTIMRHLFSYISKDKQRESLVEKLCQRFRTVRTDRQYRDLSYCLTLLPLSEQGLQKLHDNFDCFADKLQDPAVYSCFQTLLARFSRAGSKPEIKVRMGGASVQARKTIAFDMQRLESSRHQPLSTANSGEDFVTPHAFQKQKCAQKRRPCKKAVITFSSDEESNSEDGKPLYIVVKGRKWKRSMGLAQ